MRRLACSGAKAPWALCRAYATAAGATAASATPPQQRVALVQGSSRGLGLEYVRQLLLRPDTAAVVATCRAPATAAGLHALQAQHGTGRLQIVQLDSTDEASIAAAAEQVAASHSHLDLLVNASGILHDDSMSPETALGRVSMANLLKWVLGPVTLAVARNVLAFLARKYPYARSVSDLVASASCRPRDWPAPSARHGSSAPAKLLSKLQVSYSLPASMPMAYAGSTTPCLSTGASRSTLRGTSLCARLLRRCWWQRRVKMEPPSE